MQIKQFCLYILTSLRDDNDFHLVKFVKVIGVNDAAKLQIQLQDFYYRFIRILYRFKDRVSTIQSDVYWMANLKKFRYKKKK